MKSEAEINQLNSTSEREKKNLLLSFEESYNSLPAFSPKEKKKKKKSSLKNSRSYDNSTLKSAQRPRDNPTCDESKQITSAPKSTRSPKYFARPFLPRASALLETRLRVGRELRRRRRFRGRSPSRTARPIHALLSLALTNAESVRSPSLAHPLNIP